MPTVLLSNDTCKNGHTDVVNLLLNQFRLDIQAKNVCLKIDGVKGHVYVVKLQLTNKIILNIPRGVLNMLVLSAAMFLA